RFYLLQEIRMESGFVYYEHDDVGNVTSKRVAQSGETYFEYDRLNRNTSITYPDGKNVSFEYFKTDLLKTVERGNAEWKYLYDANNNLYSETLNITAESPSFPEARSYGLTYTFDAMDGLKTVTYPSNLKIDYIPNAFGRPAVVNATLNGTAADAFASAVEYHPNGQLKSVTAGNGMTIEYGQDEQQRLSTLLVTGGASGSGQTLLDRTHGYDSANLLTQVSDALTASNSRVMTYDGLGRLRTASGEWGDSTISYDDVNNILSRSVGADDFTYTYDAQNRVDTVSGAVALSYEYDVYGNATSSGRTSFGDYTFDDASLLTMVSDADGTDRIEYDHDGNKRTVLERLVDGSSTVYKAYNLDGDLMFEEDLVSGKTKDYIYLGSSLLSTRVADAAVAADAEDAEPDESSSESKRDQERAGGENNE
ncbi:MAG: hypothetical protein AAF497_13395, partial [Planctomycetota bacterium]